MRPTPESQHTTAIRCANRRPCWPATGSSICRIEALCGISGPDRLTWLHSLTTQYLEGIEPGVWTTTLVLSPQGHVEHELTGYDDGESFWAHTEPGAAAAAVGWLDSMRFMMRVEVADVTDDWAVVARSATERELISRPELANAIGSASSVGDVGLRGAADRAWRAHASVSTPTTRRSRTRSAGSGRRCISTKAATADRRRLRASTRSAVRRGGWFGSTSTARSIGSRRSGDPLLLGEREIGRLGSVARHYELGPIALGVVKRNVDVDAVLTVDGIPASQEAVVDPEVGLHVRARLYANSPIRPSRLSGPSRRRWVGRHHCEHTEALGWRRGSSRRRR